MYKITRNIILDVNNSTRQRTITIPQETADEYRLAIHVTENGQTVDLSDYCVKIKAVRINGTEVCVDCTVSGDTAYYILEPQFATVVGWMECWVEISKLDSILYTVKFRCIITHSAMDTQYVTPEMFGAYGEDGIIDNTEAVQQAFDTGKDVVFLNDYFITEPIEIHGKSNFKVYGNNHTLTVSSKQPTDTDKATKYTFFLYECDSISFENLTIESLADQSLIGIGQVYSYPFKSSNVEGFKIQESNNITIKNYTSHYLHSDISLQGCRNIQIDHWYSNNCLMGLYTSASADISVSNFKIVLDPDNAIQNFHAFYLCYGVRNVYISNGEAIFKNKYENVENVLYFDNTPSPKVSQREPLFTIHRDGKGDGQKQIYVDNVKFTAQRIINVTEMSDTPVFSNCIFTTHYPEDALNEHSRGNGQITLSCDTTFNSCIFHLGGRDRGFETGENSGKDYTILLKDCQLYCTNKAGFDKNKPLLGFNGNFKLINCFIEWLALIRRLRVEGVVTEFYNCNINIPISRAVIMYDPVRITTATESSIINSIINNGYYISYETAYQEGKLNIINSHLISNNTKWYQSTVYGGSVTGFSPSVKIYNSFLNDKKISTTSGTADSNALATHMVDPHAHANIELDGNDSN